VFRFNRIGGIGGTKAILGVAVAYMICGSRIIEVVKAAGFVALIGFALAMLIAIFASHWTRKPSVTIITMLIGMGLVAVIYSVPAFHTSHLSWFTGLWSLRGGLAGMVFLAGWASSFLGKKNRVSRPAPTDQTVTEPPAPPSRVAAGDIWAD